MSLLSPTLVNRLGWYDARVWPSDWDFNQNPFWTSFSLSLLLFPCLFYLTWYLNPSLTKNRAGLSWVLGFYSASLFTLGGFFEAPHLRTVFSAMVDYDPHIITTVISATTSAVATAATEAATVVAAAAATTTATAAATTAETTATSLLSSSSPVSEICLPMATAAVSCSLLMASWTGTGTGTGSGTGTGPCGSDGSLSTLLSSRLSSRPPPLVTTSTFSETTSPFLQQFDLASFSRSKCFNREHPPVDNLQQLQQQQQQQQQQHQWQQMQFLCDTTSLDSDMKKQADNLHNNNNNNNGIDKDMNKDEKDMIPSRLRAYQQQMTAPHLFYSLENYPEDSRINTQIMAGNFQAFLVVDLILGSLHYRRQLEPFSTVVHHIIYYFIVVHMRRGNMLSVFCILGTFIETSSIFLAWGRMFPHRRTPAVEGMYLLSFIVTRLLRVGLLWHEIYYNYPDKSVTVLFTITLSLHVYWFVLYLHLQKKYRSKMQRSHLSEALESLANSVEEETMRLKSTTSRMVSSHQHQHQQQHHHHQNSSLSSSSSSLSSTSSSQQQRQQKQQQQQQQHQHHHHLLHPTSPIIERSNMF